MKAITNQIGTNCWSAKRYCGGRCDRVFRCDYPDRKTCKAVAMAVGLIKQSGERRIAQINRVAQEGLRRLALP